MPAFKQTKDNIKKQIFLDIVLGLSELHFLSLIAMVGLSFYGSHFKWLSYEKEERECFLYLRHIYNQLNIWATVRRSEDWKTNY